MSKRAHELLNGYCKGICMTHDHDIMLCLDEADERLAEIARIIDRVNSRRRHNGKIASHVIRQGEISRIEQLAKGIAK